MTNSCAPVISLMGPTASGKTGLAIELAKYLPVEVISVDSALIYRHMDIGTAKPDLQERQGVVHHLIDIRDPAESYSVAEFSHDCQQLVDAIQARGNVPVLTGGTMMYFNAIVKGIARLPAADAGMRQQILQEAEQHGWSSLHAQLQTFDPVAAARIHPNDPQRLSRALEVYRLSGKTLTELQAENHGQLRQPLIQFAIAPQQRDVLHARIEQRFDMMLAAGVIDEVKALKQRQDLHLDLPAIRAVGYRQIWQYLDGAYDESEMRASALAATRQLAKRQLTWLRGWDDLNWLDTFGKDNVGIILKWLES